MKTKSLFTRIYTRRENTVLLSAIWLLPIGYFKHPANPSTLALTPRATAWSAGSLSTLRSAATEDASALLQLPNAATRNEL